MNAKTELLHVSPKAIVVEEGFNPRRDFGNLADLAEDIKANGVQTPLLVRLNGADGNYILVDGERRFRAVSALLESGHKVKTVPVLVSDMKEEEQLAAALSTGTSSKPLTISEEAEVVRRFVKDLGWKQRDLGVRLGRSQSWISSRYKIATAIPEVRDALESGKLRTQKAIDIAREKRSDQSGALEKALGKKPKGEDDPDVPKKPGKKDMLRFIRLHVKGYDATWTPDELESMLLWAIGERSYNDAVLAVGTEPMEDEIDGDLEEDTDRPQPPSAPSKPE